MKNQTVVSADKIYGLISDFNSPEALLSAAQSASRSGYKQLEAFSPFPVAGLDEALHLQDRRLPFLVLLGGIFGGVGGFLMQYYASVIAYPFNVAGKPLNSWPAFIPVTFEMTVLCAAGTAVFGMLILNRLPEPYHPVFNVKNFSRFSQDRFFLCIRSTDPLFELNQAKTFLASLGPDSIEEVES